MARPRKSGAAPSPRLTGGQASYVLERLLKDRRVNQSDVNRYVSEMSAEIGQLEERLRHLRDAVGGAASAAASGIASVAASAVAAVRRGRKPGRPKGSGRGPGRPPGSGTGVRRGPGRPPRAAAAPAAPAAAPTTAAKGGGKKRGRKTPITSEQLASRQLQGRYLSLVRRFPANRRAAFAKTAKEKGREAAIREMQSSLPSGK